MVDDHGGAPGRCRAGEFERLEQRRNRAFCTDGTQLHPQNADGSISIEKAVAINEAFQISRQFWAHQVERGVLRTPRSFINTVPHMSFVWGGITLISCAPVTPRCNKARCFRGMRYSEDHAQIKEWAPLVMEGRDPQQKVAATRTEIGTDVNYGEITRQLIASLQKKSNFSLQLS